MTSWGEHPVKRQCPGRMFPKAWELLGGKTADGNRPRPVPERTGYVPRCRVGISPLTRENAPSRGVHIRGGSVPLGPVGPDVHRAVRAPRAPRGGPILWGVAEDSAQAEVAGRERVAFAAAAHRH